MKIGLLHPGDMGSSVGHCLKQAGNDVCWLPAGRSDRTRERAEKAGLTAVESLALMAKQCQVIVSVCPPEFSQAVASAVSETGFTGIFVEANAISPAKSIALANSFDSSRVTFIDPGLVGSPAWQAGTTTLYLSGAGASALAPALEGGNLAIKVLDEKIGSASAMKMCFAAYTKGSKALVASILGAADYYGVSEPLRQQWGDKVIDERIAELQRIAGRAWRWEDEMLQIAETLACAGMPDGSHRAASEIYGRLAEFRDCEEPPQWQQLLASLRHPDN